MPMSKKDFIAAADMVREIGRQLDSLITMESPTEQREYGFIRVGYEEAVAEAKKIVLEEVIALCKRCQSPSGMGFKEQTFRDYVEGR